LLFVKKAAMCDYAEHSTNTNNFKFITTMSKSNKIAIKTGGYAFLNHQKYQQKIKIT